MDSPRYILFKSCTINFLQPYKHRKHEECKRDDKQNKLEYDRFLKPFSKAYVGKSQSNEQRTAGRIQNVRITVRKQIGQNDNRFADPFYRRQGKHWDNQHSLCRCAWNEKFDDQNERVQNDDRKIRRNVRDQVVEVMEDGMQDIAFLCDIGDTEGYHNYYDRGKDVLYSLYEAFSEALI